MAQFHPQPFGKYYLVDKLAVGGMAEIFLAKPPQAAAGGPTYLVIKRILPHYSTNAQFVDMFIDEAKISVQLEHENIVPVFDLGKVGETYFLAMQFVAGQDLKAIVTRCRERSVRLPCEHAAYIVGDLLKGLDYAHKKTDRTGKPLNIVHRDISPQNVLVGYDGSVKVTDFGIAKAESKLDSTQVGTLKGKFGYMAPEQVVSGGPALDHRSDIFAAGIILWELVTGHRLFSGSNEIEILERVRAAKFDAPSSFVPDIPRELERIIFRALMKDREKRYASALEMHQDITQFLEGFAPEFSRSEMAGVMEELFTPEMDLAKSRWNVVIGPVIDKTKVAIGAAQESTRPDQTKLSETLPKEPVKTKLATPAPGARPGPGEPLKTKLATPAPQAIGPPDAAITKPGAKPATQDMDSGFEARTAEPRSPRASAVRTQINPPRGSQALRSEDLFDEDGPASSAAERTSTSPAASSSSPRQDANAARLSAPSPARAVPVSIPVAAPPPPLRAPARTPPRSADPDFLTAAESASSTMREAPRAGSGAGSGSVAPLVRRSLLALFGVVLFGTGVGLALIGELPNPFVSSTLEVVSTVDAMISIDGKVVLGAGRAGSWNVGAGIRTVEVKQQGYVPFVKQVNAVKGERVFVDAVLVPLPDAVSDIPIVSTPPGAQVYLDGELLEGGTPMTLHLKIGDHILGLVREGYGQQTRELHAGRPGLGKAAEFTLVAVSAAIRVLTDPPGADVTVDGAVRGKSPAVIGGLEIGKPIEVSAVLKGFAAEKRTITPAAGADPFAVNLRLVPASSTATPRPPDPAENLPE